MKLNIPCLIWWPLFVTTVFTFFNMFSLKPGTIFWFIGSKHVLNFSLHVETLIQTFLFGWNVLNSFPLKRFLRIWNQELPYKFLIRQRLRVIVFKIWSIWKISQTRTSCFFENRRHEHGRGQACPPSTAFDWNDSSRMIRPRLSWGKFLNIWPILRSLWRVSNLILSWNLDLYVILKVIYRCIHISITERNFENFQIPNN